MPRRTGLSEMESAAAQFRVLEFSVPVVSEPDVCVIGGGATGLAAAVAAARLKLNVLLVERYGFCGGATVAGLSGTICGLYAKRDIPEQIIFGFAEEFRAAMEARGGTNNPTRFGKTFLLPHDSFVWKETSDALLAGSGAVVLFHTNFVRAYADQAGNIHTILLRALEGFVAVKARVVVDASGDAEVVHSLGLGTTEGRNGVVQTPTMIFRMGNVDMPRFLALDPNEIIATVKNAQQTRRPELPRSHVYLFPMPNGREVLCNMTKITFADGAVPSGVSSADMTFAEQEGRRQARSYARFLQERIDGFEHAYLVETGAQVGIRQTRSICGKSRLSNDDVYRGKKYPGAATFSAWPIELHGADGLTIAYPENDTYDIPFETMIPVRSVNLLAAGRCLSAEHEAMASARVTAQCLGMGYTTGAACGLMLRENIAAAELTGSDVVAWMRSNHLKTAGEA